MSALFIYGSAGATARKCLNTRERELARGGVALLVVVHDGPVAAETDLPALASPKKDFYVVRKKKENRQPKGRGRGGRTARRHHTGILGEKCGASRRPPSGVYHFLSLFAVSHLFSQRPSCHLAFFPLSSFSLLLSFPLTHRSPRPRSETPLSSADLLLSLLLSPCCVTPLSSPRILVPRKKERKKINRQPTRVYPIPPLGCLFSFFLFRVYRHDHELPVIVFFTLLY